MALVSHFSEIMAIFTLPFQVLRGLGGSPPGLPFPGAHTDVVMVRYRAQARLLRPMSSVGSPYKRGEGGALPIGAVPHGVIPRDAEDTDMARNRGHLVCVPFLATVSL